MVKLYFQLKPQGILLRKIPLTKLSQTYLYIALTRTCAKSALNVAKMR